MITKITDCKFINNLDSFRYMGAEEYDFCYSIAGDYNSYGDINHGDISLNSETNELCLILKTLDNRYYKFSDKNVKIMTLSKTNIIKEVQKIKLKKVNLFLRIKKNDSKDLLIDNHSTILFLIMKLDFDITNINLLV